MTTLDTVPREELIHLGGDVRAHPALRDLLTDPTRLTPHPRNPRNGDTDAIGDSIRHNGLYRPLYVQRSTGHVLAGNHTYQAALELGATLLPVLWLDVDDDEATRILLTDNRTADIGQYDDALLLDVLRDIATHDAGLLGTGYTPDDLDHLAFLSTLTLDGLTRQAEVEAGQQRAARHRTLPLRLILSLNSGPSMVEAMVGDRLGWVPGVISTGINTIRRYRERYPRHTPVAFMDNPYRDYDHAAHLAAVAECKPQSCTTRDLFTKQQAAEEGLDYLTVEQTLDQAADLAEHVEDVILIPKFDCLDRIPDTVGDARVVLGYSVETSYGGTQLPVEAFKGRPVHLLGGSWAKQRAYLNILGDDCVALDNNHILRVAQFGQVCRRDGSMTTLVDVLGSPQWSVYFGSMVLSLTEIATAVHDDYGVPLTEHTVEDDNWDEMIPDLTGEHR